MTTEELAKLTPEEKQSMVAKLIGWKPIDPPFIGKFCVCPWRDPLGHERVAAPDFLNDLNAMHAAEEWEMDHEDPGLTGTREGFVNRYCRALHEVCSVPPLATAAERADAFLLTLG